jgi:oligosaccharyltransferase complex subunit epsilon
MQTNVENKAEFESISHERAFADFVFGSLLLHFFCVNFIN